MTVRGRLNLAFTILIAVILLAGGFALNAVHRSANHVHAYSRMREVSHLTSDLRTAVYQELAITAKLIEPPAGHDHALWTRYWVDDIDVQLNHSTSAKERTLWNNIRDSIQLFDGLRKREAGDRELNAVVQRMEVGLRQLRDHYDVSEFDSIRVVSGAVFQAQVAVGIACLFTVLMFLIYLVMIRHWLVYPIEILRAATEKIGEGRLDYSVPLHGKNELAELARGIETMASRIANHQQALLEARELSAIGELCTNVAHGLRNPLASLRATAELAHRRLKDAPAVQSLLHAVLEQADRVDQRITRLFQFSRPMSLHLKTMSFADLAKAVNVEVETPLKQKDLRLSVEDSCNGQTCLLDKEAIIGALAELVMNAAHHSEPGHQITLRGAMHSSASSNGKALLHIEVIDHGAGMPPQTIDKAFQLFFTSRPEGTGMGLAMVKRTVERHGGTIGIDSSLGVGTRITLSFPTSQTLH